MPASSSSPDVVLEAALRRRRVHILAYREARRASAAKHRDKRLGSSDAVAQLFAPDAAPLFLSLHKEESARRQRPPATTDTPNSESRMARAPRAASLPRRPSSWPARRGGLSVTLSARQRDIRCAQQFRAEDEAQSAAVKKTQSHEIGVAQRPAQPRLRRWTRARRRACLRGITRPASVRKYWCDGAANQTSWSFARSRRRRILRRALRAVDARALPCKESATVTRASLLRLAAARANAEMWRLVQAVAQTRATFLATLSQQQARMTLAKQAPHATASPGHTFALAHAFPWPGATVKVHWCLTETWRSGGGDDYGVDVVREQHGVVLWETLSSLGVVLLPAPSSPCAKDIWALVRGDGGVMDELTRAQGEILGATCTRLGRVIAEVVHVVRLFPASSGTRACAVQALATRLPAWRRKHGPHRQFLFASADHSIAPPPSMPPLLQCLHNRYL